MLTFFRRASKSRFGTWVSAFFLIAILAGFAIADISNFGTGNVGFGMGSSTLARVGNQQLTEKELSDTIQRRLQQLRSENPQASFATIAGEYEPTLNALIDQKAILAFADKFGFRLSKRQVDAEIAKLPAAQGINGKFSEEAYQKFLAQQKITDADIREIVAGQMLQQYMFIPLVANPRVSVGMARPYASMLLEQRQGEAAAIPVASFTAGLKPTNADLQGFYAANRARYMIPEQRVLRLARIGPEQVAGIIASDQEIAAAYNARKAEFAAKDVRSLSQVVVQDQAAANAIAAKAKAGTPLSAAAGANGAVTALTDQNRAGYASVAGNQAASAVFSAKQGDVVGPFKSSFGWVVTKIDAVKAEPGKTLEQARGEIAAKLNADKRKQAIEDIVDKVQNATDDGANFSEAAAQAKLAVTATPLITANGASRAEPGFKAPAALAPVLKTGFEIAQSDPPEIVSLAGDQGYVMVAPGQIVPAAPAPLASILDRVTKDWIEDQARKRAGVAARAIAAKVERGMPLAQAMKEANANLPPIRPLDFRRIQVATAKTQVPPVVQMLFTLVQGKSRLIPDPQGNGYFIVKVNKVVPGNAVAQPALINQMQTDLVQPLQQEFAQQFVAAMRNELKVKRNDKAIAALKARLASSGE
ncbi:MAG: SurA N-terminal domain-containing protein [Pseudomonadota bacterium]